MHFASDLRLSVLSVWPSCELHSNMDYLWTFYSLGRFHPEEIKRGKRKQSGQILQPGCKKIGKKLTGP